MRLDIVMPAHNEEDRIDRTLRAYRSACPDEGVRLPRRARFVHRPHAARSSTPMQREDDRVRSFEYPKLGKGGVIAETFARSDAELVGFVDADGATPPRELLRLADARAGTPTARSPRAAIPPSLLPARRPLAREITSAGLRRQRAHADGPARTATRSAGRRCCAATSSRDVLPRLAARDLLFDVDLLAPRATPAGAWSRSRRCGSTRRARASARVADSRRMGTSLLRLWLRRRHARRRRAHEGRTRVHA